MLAPALCLADTKISALPSASAQAGTEVLPEVQSAATVGVTVNQLKTYIAPVAANPTGSVGLTATNGVATTFDRSDATHALDVTIAPTWTGIHTYSGNSLGSAITDRVILQNATAAAAGAQQYSPALHFIGQGWKTNATAASQQVEFQVYLKPIQLAASPSTSLVFVPTVNGSAANGLAFCSGGALQPGTFLVGLDGVASYNCDSGSGFSGLGPANASNAFGVYNNASLQEGFVVGGITMLNVNCYTIGGTNALGDARLCRRGAASWQLGAADAAAPVAQTLSVQSVVAGTSNTAGQIWTFSDSIGTGTGASGGFEFDTHPAGTTGTSQNAALAAFKIDTKGVPVVPTFTVANLPVSPPTGSIANVSDANAGCSSGTTPTGGGSTKCFVGYNGAAWKEFGI